MHLRPSYRVDTVIVEWEKQTVQTVITVYGDFDSADISTIDSKYPGCRFTFERYESPDEFARRLAESANLCVGIEPANTSDETGFALSFDNGRGGRIFTVPSDCGAARAAADTKGNEVAAMTEEAIERAMHSFAGLLGYRIYRDTKPAR